MSVTNLQDSTERRNWLKFLSFWALGVCAVVASLIVTIIVFVMPASEPNVLGETYFELMAAGHAPGIYRLAIAFDVAAWIGWGGLFVAFAALLRQAAPVRSALIALLASGMVAGFIGACLRIVGIPHIASQYVAAPAAQQAVLIQAYDSLLQIINILFSAGGLLAGVALLLIVSSVRHLPKLPKWVTVLIWIAGLIQAGKAMLELTTGTDLGPLALLANVLLIVALLVTSKKFYAASLSQS